MQYPLIEFLASHFWWTIISVGGIVYILLNAYLVHREQERADIEPSGLFVSAGQELDVVCHEIDIREEANPAPKSKRGK